MGKVDVISVLDDAISDALEDGNPIHDALKLAGEAIADLIDSVSDYTIKRSTYFSTKITDCELRSSDAWEAYMKASSRLEEAIARIRETT